MSASTVHPVTSESVRVIRDRQFSPEGGEDAILRALAHLRHEHVCGTLMIDIANGGIGSLRFHEEQQVNFPDK